MEIFNTLIGPAAALMRSNVDTDVIIRIERLTSTPRDKWGDYALEALRFQPDGTEDPQFVLNQAAFRQAPILIAGKNFGCGSSREGAVVALRARGIRCVIAPSFGDIFLANCFQNGVLAMQLPEADVGRLAEDSRQGGAFQVDLHAQSITSPSHFIVKFDIDRLRKEGLLQGLDEIGLTIKDDAQIRAWQHADRGARPWVWAPVTRRTLQSTGDK